PQACPVCLTLKSMLLSVPPCTIPLRRTSGLGADPHHYSCDLEGTQPSLISQQSLQFYSTVLISWHHRVALGGRAGFVPIL
uniref:Uncharacterized protein n=1 Tax=Saimiri boliviensis boliviensis TaxID=39432 RepID=A0A2K6UU27_SAIBB